MYISFCTFVTTFLFLLCTKTSAQKNTIEDNSENCSSCVINFPEERCFTPMNVNGNCINIKNCSPIINILKKEKSLTQETIEYLRASQCGFEGTTPKVCCPVQTAPIPTPPTSTTQETSDAPDISNHPNLRILDLNLCGHTLKTKIFGGNKTGVLEYPWMALLAYNTGEKTPEFRCGGSLITKRYVLTAAHCVTSLQSGLKLVGVRVGEHDLKTERDCDKDENGIILYCADKYQDLGIESVHSHPEFSQSLQNDIALIRLNNDADFTANNIRPICLPIQHSAMIAKKLTATGWGATESGVRSFTLLQVKLPEVANAQCKETYKSRIQIWYKQLCAGGEKDKDSCSGDSGGPLQAPGLLNNKSRYFQYGIVSFGMKNCGISGFPGVYTNIKYYMDWILDNIRD